MLGAIIGDIAGSRFELAYQNKRTKDFRFLSHSRGCRPTDDSFMTLAVGNAILLHDGTLDDLERQAIFSMQLLGRKYGDERLYGKNFNKWIKSRNPKPYPTKGNGAAMRVSPCGFAASSLDEAISLADAVTKVSHDTEQAKKAAKAVSAAIFLARQGRCIPCIQKYVEDTFGYRFNFTLKEIRPTYWLKHDLTCDGTVPQAFEAFFESEGFEDAVRNAISIGGDSDTIAAITGGLAEAYYGIPEEIRNQAFTFLDDTQRSILNSFESKYSENTKPAQVPIRYVIGSITDLNVDAIVNTTNKELKLSSGDVETAIHAAAGPELEIACRALQGCEVGEAKHTSGFRLAAKHIIHTVGPYWSKDHQKSDKLLCDCYWNSLEKAKELGDHSIAFPAISSGKNRYPRQRAACVATKTTMKWLREHPDYHMDVIFVCNEKKAMFYQKAATCLSHCEIEKPITEIDKYCPSL